MLSRLLKASEVSLDVFDEFLDLGKHFHKTQFDGKNVEKIVCGPFLINKNPTTTSEITLKQTKVIKKNLLKINK